MGEIPIFNQIISIVGSGLSDYRAQAIGSGWPAALAVYVVNFDDMAKAGGIWASGFTIGTGVSRLPPRPPLSGNLPGRKELWILNNDNAETIYIGQSGVTVSIGFPVATGTIVKLNVAGNVDVFAIANATGVQVKTLEIS